MQIKPKIRNVIVFGETGAGKSSTINMLANDLVAKVSDSSSGCTFESTPYEMDIEGSRYRIFDTAGLNEGTKGTVAPADAVTELYKLIHDLEDGVNLLVYCVRGPRIGENIVNNYKMFYSVFCKQQVPIVLFMTGLEGVDNPDVWWRQNESAFRKHGMRFAGHVCGTATRGKKNHFETEYQETWTKLRRLIREASLPEPWKMERTRWFVTVMKGLWNHFGRLFGWKIMAFSEELCRALQEFSGLSADDAARFANSAFWYH